MKKIIFTVLITLVILISGLYLYISSGMYDISQLAPHNALTKSIIKKTTHSSINNRLKEIEVPDNLQDIDLIILGFKHYDEMCSGCHGAPGVEQREMVQGLYPKPPKIYKFSEPDDAKEFFWITKYGIKMTSMPAFQPTHNDAQIWAITAFVTQKLSKMSPEEYKQWAMKNSSDEGSAETEGAEHHSE